MVNIDKKYIGWVQAVLLVVVFWALCNVFMSYATQKLEINKIIFAVISYISCSTCLLLYSKDGPLSRETMRSVDTWAYGFIILVNYFAVLNLYSVISASKASLIHMTSVVFSLIASWLFLFRTPSKHQLLGCLMILSGVIYVLSNTTESSVVLLSVLTCIAGVSQALRIFIAEFHRPNKKAIEIDSLKTRCRVIGYISFVIAIVFAFFVFIAAVLQSYVPELEQIKVVIKLEDFIHYPSILSGMFMGVFISTPIRFLEFSATEKIKTENLLAIGALSFFATWFWEWATSPITGLSLKELSSQDIAAGVIITVGALVMAISKIVSSKEEKSDLSKFLKADSQNIDRVDESRELVANTLEHFQSDIEKTAKALNIPVESIAALLQDKDKILAFRSGILRKVASNYRKNVASLDALTGLLNRSGFMTELNSAVYEVDNVSLFFIDLNKFKPVNDTYGHDAGDYVLQEIACRLQNLFGENSIATRLGGDEFCLLLLGVDKSQAEAKIETISKSLEKEIEYKGNKINVSSSIGLASYPEDTKSTEELMKLADKQMYIDKNDRER